MRTVLAIAASAAFGFVACGTSQSDGFTASADATAYDEAALAVSQAVAGYRAAATGATVPADCTAAAQRYAGQVTPSVDRMLGLADRMDTDMRAMGHRRAPTCSAGWTCSPRNSRAAPGRCMHPLRLALQPRRGDTPLRRDAGARRSHAHASRRARWRIRHDARRMALPDRERLAGIARSRAAGTALASPTLAIRLPARPSPIRHWRRALALAASWRSRSRRARRPSP